VGWGEIDETGHLLGLRSHASPADRSLQIRGELKAGKSKPPPADEATGVQVDGVRLEIFGEFQT
jgi:hypothetical protein